MPTSNLVITYKRFSSLVAIRHDQEPLHWWLYVTIKPAAGKPHRLWNLTEEETCWRYKTVQRRCVREFFGQPALSLLTPRRPIGSSCHRVQVPIEFLRRTHSPSPEFSRKSPAIPSIIAIIIAIFQSADAVSSHHHALVQLPRSSYFNLDGCWSHPPLPLLSQRQCI